MPKLPGIKHRAAIRALERAGFRVDRESGHVIMTNGQRRVIIPRGSPINAFTMAAIVRDAGLTIDQFKALL